MEEFNELSIEEMQEVDGGGIFSPLLMADEIASAMDEMGDFISGFADGFYNGFKSTNKYWN